jgi:protein HIRA/HIR1
VISGHSGFVKGLTWDPVGKFLASQVPEFPFAKVYKLDFLLNKSHVKKSDDKTVKIWRSSDWTMEEQIRAPYEHAATVSFFRRLRYIIDLIFQKKN